MTSPLSEKISVAIRFRRISSTTKACCSAVKPGAMPISDTTMGSAKIAMMTESAAAVMNARFAIEEKSFHPAFLPSRSMISAITGINAIESAPPLMSVKSISGRLLAMLKTSNSTESPNCRAMIS